MFTKILFKEITQSVCQFDVNDVLLVYIRLILVYFKISKQIALQ